MAAPTSPILDTHTLETDTPHALSSVERWTCTRCGCAVLVKGGHVYGSASVEECGNPAPAAVPVDTSPAGTLRRAAAKLRQEITAVEADLRDNAYWGGEQRPLDAYARGVADGLGGPAGTYAATMGPAVGLALADWLDHEADTVTATAWCRDNPGQARALAVACAVLGEQR